MNSVCMRRPAEILGVIEAAGERDALGLRQLLENLGALFFGQILEDRHRVVGFDLAHALGDGSRLQFFENFLAHLVVDFGKSGKVEVDAEQFDQARAHFRFERPDHGAEIGFVQTADQPPQRLDVAGLDGCGHAAEITLADGAVVVARQCSDFSFSHAGSRRCDERLRAACSRRPGTGQMINA